MSRYLDKLPLVDGFYLARKYFSKWSQNHQDNGNGNKSIVFKSTLTDKSPYSSPKLIAKNQENCLKQHETDEKAWIRSN